MPSAETVYFIITLITGFIVASAYITSKIRKQRTDELEGLAKARGERIEDLEAQINRLESRITKLEGAYDALQTFKVQEIADAVVAKLLSDDGIPI